MRIRPIQAARRSISGIPTASSRSEEHTSELQSRLHLVCRLLLEKKNKNDQLPIRNALASRHKPSAQLDPLANRHAIAPITYGATCATINRLLIVTLRLLSNAMHL